MNSSIMVSSGDPKLDKFINDYLRPLKSGRTPISKLVDEMYEKWLNKDLPGYGDLVTESQIKKMMFDYIKHTRATFAGKDGQWSIHLPPTEEFPNLEGLTYGSSEIFSVDTPHSSIFDEYDTGIEVRIAEIADLYPAKFISVKDFHKLCENVMGDDAETSASIINAIDTYFDEINGKISLYGGNNSVEDAFDSVNNIIDDATVHFVSVRNRLSDMKKLRRIINAMRKSSKNKT